MTSHFIQAVVFLVEVVFGLYLVAVLLRYLLARVHADFYNPLSQFIVKLTDPAIKPLRRCIPGYGGIDWPSVILLLLIQGAEIVLVTLAVSGQVPALTGLAVLTVAHILKLVIYVYIFIILIQVIVSWMNPGAYHNPVIALTYQLCEPLLNPVRRLIPPAAGFDWSPLIVMIVLNLMVILMVTPLMDLGQRLSY